MNTGQMDERIVVERAVETEDDLGTGVPAWSVLVERWAEVLFGTGRERREAAQSGSTAPATFLIRWDPVTATITPADRLQAFGAEWDISSAFPVGHNDRVEITATRKVT